LLNFKNPFNGRTYYKPSTTSTMLDATQNPSHGAIFLADGQTQGQGRFVERKWESVANQDLTFTLVLQSKNLPTDRPIPLIVALALQQTLPLFGAKAQIKWPNDLLYEHRKLSGILCKQDENFTYIGIGLNLVALYDKEHNDRISLHMITGVKYDRFVVLEALLSQLNTSLNEDDWLYKINKALYKPSKVVTYVSSNECTTGLVTSVQADGALVLDTYQGLKPIYDGEAKRR
jgi:BirA family biotin operon repressor/biotin-[acetyl-CoA-carboxylase] ligase